MIKKEDHVRRQTCADLGITDVIRKALADNYERIPYTSEGGFIATEIGESEDDEHVRIIVSGFMGGGKQFLQEVTVVYFDTVSRANRFLASPEGQLFEDTYSDGQDCFDYTTYAGNPVLPSLIATILRNHYGFKENSHLTAHTYCQVDYFRKDPDDSVPKPPAS